MDALLIVVGVVADIAAIVTSFVAVWAWLRFKSDDKGRRRKLEEYLMRERTAGGNYQHSAIHLSAHLGMSEAQIFEAATTSEHIRLLPGQDERGFANRILFEYTTGSAEGDWKLEGLDPKKARR